MRALVLGMTLATLIAAPVVACGHPGSSRPSIPAPGESIDAFLPEARLPEADRDQVQTLRDNVGWLMVAQQVAEARRAEEVAMRILGFEKLWLRCGSGTFIWHKLEPVLTQ